MMKMSKSDKQPGGCVFLDDPADVVATKFRRAVTDMTTALSYEPDTRPGVSNLVALHSAFSGLSHIEVCKRFEGKETTEIKQELANLVTEHFEPIREKMADLEKRPGYVDDVLHDGAARARKIASEFLGKVKHAIGIL